MVSAMAVIDIHFGINPVRGGSPPMDIRISGTIQRISVVMETIDLVWGLDVAFSFPMMAKRGVIITT